MMYISWLVLLVLSWQIVFLVSNPQEEATMYRGIELLPNDI